MPVEFSRTMARKRIQLVPGDTNQWVDVPVITKISFIDSSDRYQETEITIDNSGDVDGRKVRVDEVKSVDSLGNPQGNSTLPVERILEWGIIDAKDRYQETKLTIDNTTGAEDLPPHFSTHFKTHVKRYTHPSNSSIWIESELIDEFQVIDGSDRYQETRYTLNNTDEEADPDDPDISDSQNGIDPAWRTDPFQNIVNWSGATALTLRWVYVVHQTQFHLPGGGTPGPTDFPVPSGSNVATQYATATSLDLFNSPTPPSGVNIVGSPSVSPNSFSFADWQVASGGGLVPGLHVSTSASFNLVDDVINSGGVGYYGDDGGTGIFGGGYFPPGTLASTIGSTSVNAGSITVNSGGPNWTRSYAEISVSSSGFTVTLVFAP